MKIGALRQKRVDLNGEASAIFDKGDKENRPLSAEERSRLDAIDMELDGVEKDIGATERHMDRQRAISGDVLTPDANSDAQAAAGKEKPKFASLGEQMIAVARAGSPDRTVDPRLQFGGSGRYVAGPTGLSEGVSSDGGFMVQSDFVSTLLDNVWDQGEITSRINTIPIGPNSNGIRMNGVDETSRANGSRWGGIQSFWTPEAGLKAPSQPKFRQIRMELEKLTGLLYATDELLDDAVALQAWITQAFQNEMTFRVEDAILNGTGAGMPLGVVNSGALVTVPKEVGQAAGTIVFPNVLKMWQRMPPRSRKTAVWYVNSDAEPQLWQLYTKVYNNEGDIVAAVQVPSISPYTPPGVNGNEFGMLLGRPVIPVEYCAGLGTTGDIILADLSQYLGIDKGDMQTASSIHVRFIYDETVFRFVYRFNGQPVWAQPVLPYRGTTVQSPFVALATRS